MSLANSLETNGVILISDIIIDAFETIAPLIVSSYSGAILPPIPISGTLLTPILTKITSSTGAPAVQLPALVSAFESDIGLIHAQLLAGSISLNLKPVPGLPVPAMPISPTAMLSIIQPPQQDNIKKFMRALLEWAVGLISPAEFRISGKIIVLSV
jgi:hypothetical protein